MTRLREWKQHRRTKRRKLYQLDAFCFQINSLKNIKKKYFPSLSKIYPCFPHISERLLVLRRKKEQPFAWRLCGQKYTVLYDIGIFSWRISKNLPGHLHAPQHDQVRRRPRRQGSLFKGWRQPMKKTTNVSAQCNSDEKGDMGMMLNALMWSKDTLLATSAIVFCHVLTHN